MRRGWGRGEEGGRGEGTSVGHRRSGRWAVGPAPPRASLRGPREGDVKGAQPPPSTFSSRQFRGIQRRKRFLPGLHPPIPPRAHQRDEAEPDDVLVLHLVQVVLDRVGDQHEHLRALVEKQHEAEVADALRGGRSGRGGGGGGRGEGAQTVGKTPKFSLSAFSRRVQAPPPLPSLSPPCSPRGSVHPPPDAPSRGRCWPR